MTAYDFVAAWGPVGKGATTSVYGREASGRPEKIRVRTLHL
jgi:hypothetical protein